jgi:outer membrane receptor protein involved in Fe transport
MLKSMAFRATLAAVACALSFSAHAVADPKQMDIPAGNLLPALEALEKQAAVELVFQWNQVKAFRTRGVKGKYEPEAAIRILLKGTPLEVRTDPNGAMVIVASRALSSNSSTAGSAELQHSSQGGQSSQGDAGAQLATAQSQVKSVHESSNLVLQEVIVTAQKREERLQDVPVPVTVLDAAALLDRGQVRLEDFFSTVPGLSFTTNGTGNNQISIRGLSTGANLTNPTVGIVLDDAPFGSSTWYGSFQQGAPDIDPSDLARIEVLRGPQGTLYGASSIGGLVKFVTADPSTSGWSGRIQGDLSAGENAANAGFGLRAAVNAPITDDMAIRASGFVRHDPGYIDAPMLGIDGVNRAEAGGGRLAFLWRISQQWSLKLSALLQDTSVDGSSVGSWPGSVLGDLQQVLYVRGGESLVSQFAVLHRESDGRTERSHYRIDKCLQHQ